jgi:hypothetical protein
MKNYILVDPTLLKEQAGLTPAAQAAGLTQGADGKPLKPRTRTQAGDGETDPKKKKKFLHFPDPPHTDGKLFKDAGILITKIAALKIKTGAAKVSGKQIDPSVQLEIESLMDEVKLIQEEFEHRAGNAKGEAKKRIEAFRANITAQLGEMENSVKDYLTAGSDDPAVTPPNDPNSWEVFLRWIGHFG